MHVLLIANELAYFRAHREGLMFSLLRMGARVTVACGGSSAQEKPVRPDHWPQEVEFIALALERHRLSPFVDASLLRQFLNLVRRLKPDVVHAITIKPAVIMAVAARMLGREKPALVLTLPGLGKVFEASSKVSSLVRRAIVARILRRAIVGENACITVENPGDCERLSRLAQLPVERVIAIAGTGLNRSVFHPREREDRPAGSPLRVLMASRLIGEKGVDTYIEAARRCGAAGEPLSFALAGAFDPSNADALTAADMSALAKEGVVDWLGTVAMADMPDLLRRSDIVCLPTRLQEGFPRALLEAAACGCAMVASDQPAVRQIVYEGETGLLLDPPDAENLVAALLSIARQPNRAEMMGQNASALVQKMPVGEEEVARAFVDVYQRAGAGSL